MKEEENVIDTYIDIQRCEIPFSFYQMNSINNVLNIVYYGVTSLSVSYIISKGNCSINSLIKFILTQTNGNIKASYNKLTGILTLTLENDLYASFDIKKFSFSPIIGFSEKNNYSSSNKILSSLFPASLITIKRLKICSSQLCTESYDSLFYNLNLLRTIPVNTTPYSVISYYSPNTYNTVLKRKVIDYIDIQILDDLENYINFNNHDWSISLVFTRVKKTLFNNVKFNDSRVGFNWNFDLIGISLLVCKN